MIRLVASDMDGTLLNSHGIISSETVQAIRKLNAMGIRFLVCTGRSRADAKPPLDRWGIRCDMICMNGAAVFDQSGNQIRKKTLEYDQVKRIVKLSRRQNVIFDFMTDQGSFTTTSMEMFRQSFERGILLPMAVKEHTFESIARQFRFVEDEKLMEMGLDFYKISVIHEDPEVLADIRRSLNQMDEISIASSASTNLELTHEAAKKGAALMEYARSHGILPKEIMAVGDSENDLSMLNLPLGFTVAMENGMASVKEAAKYRTCSNDNHGVKFAIESLVLCCISNGEARA